MSKIKDRERVREGERRREGWGRGEEGIEIQV